VSGPSIRGTFVCIVALLAAVLGDALVEGLSNAGILWHGQYTDQSSLDLFPVLLAVIAIALMLGRSVKQQIRATGLPARTLIVSTSRALIPNEIAAALPAIFSLQLFILFSMETIEQIVVYGHDFGGTLWLGGPIAVSLLIHALFAVACAFLLSGALRALTNALIRVVRCIFARYVELVRTGQVETLRSTRECAAPQLIISASIVERGPPLRLRFALR
jgi:hypothetical protein